MRAREGGGVPASVEEHIALQSTSSPARPESDILTLEDYGRIRYTQTRRRRVVKSFHSLIYHYLQLLISESLPDGKRHLAFNVAPRHGKTSIISVDFPSYCLGLAPDCKFIMTSHGARLSIRNAVKVRTTIQSNWYQQLFPHTGIKGRSKNAGAQDYFETDEGGHLLATGVGATGHGAGCLRPGFGGALIIDDSLKREDARSEVMRKKVIDWYREAAKPCLNSPRTPILLIAQRLHPDDIMGYIQAEEADDWCIISIPAMDEETGGVIWPDRKSAAELKVMKEVDPFTYYTQYQQSPIIPGGAVLKDEWWRTYDDLMSVEKSLTGKFITADTAYKTKEWNSYSVLQCWGIQGTERLYLLDQRRGRWEYPQLVSNAKDFWDKHSSPGGPLKPATAMFFEDKASGQSLIQTFSQQGIPAKAWKCHDYGIAEDKTSRARECAFLVFGGAIWLPEKRIAPWVSTFRAECSNFSDDGSHSFDDQVDTFTSAALLWRKLGGGRGIVASAV